MGSKTFSSIGTVTKKEKLTVAEQIKATSSLILETLNPYSGYYGTTVPDNDDPISIFLVTKHIYNEDKVIRFIQNVKKTFKTSFDAVPGQITLSNKSMGIIRIRCISQTQIGELIEAFKKQGAEFMPKQRLAPFDGLIKITKYFNTEEVEDGIFFDADNPAFAYIRVDSHLRWSSFESVNSHIIHNIDGLTFDAAQATMYNCNGIIDFIRVYDAKRSIEKLKTIRSRYLDAIQKHGHKAL